MENSKSRKLSAATIEGLEPVFKLFDRDNKNYITENDLMVAMAAFGYHPTKTEVKNMLNISNGQINFEEFVCIFEEKCSVSELTEDKILASFKVFDKDGNGVISREEIRDVLKCHIERPTEEDIDEILNEADENKDGQIDFSEYVALCKKK